MNKDPGASPGANESGEITLGLLTAVEANSQLTQRSAAKELGVALGLVNAYLKRCIRKGLIKVKQAPANRYAYYVTPKGFAEKSRLTVEYLSVSLAFFRSARNQCSDLFAECVARGHTRIALAGVGELAEIATLCARDHPVDLVGIIDPKAGVASFASLEVFPSPDGLGPINAVIVTDVSAPQATFDRMAAEIGAERVMAPKLLNLSLADPGGPATEEAGR